MRPKASRGGAGLLAAVMVVVSGACGPDEPEGLTETIDRLVLDAMEEGPIAGVAVGVARGSRIVHLKGYGYADIENELPVTPETVFRIGSITKQFTAALVVDLEDDEALSFDDRLTDYLPDYPGYGSEVTVASLLNHTSGIKNYTTMGSWWETLSVEMPPRRLIALFGDEPFDFGPRTRFSYSNSGYVVLGWLIEQVTGRPYGGVLNERFFVPFELSATSYCDDRALVPNRARGYQVVDGEFQHATYVSMSQAYAAGGVCSNVPDLIRWSRLLSAGRVVGREGYERMSTPGRLLDGAEIEYGYGMAVSYLQGHHRVSHVGGMLGFTGQIAHYDQDDVTVVVLTNTEGARAATLEGDIARLMLGLQDEAVHDLLLAPEELAQYTGTYDLGIAVVGVTGEDGRLEVEASVPGLEEHYVLLYQGDHRFVAESDTETSVTFAVATAGGRADRVTLFRNGITLHGERIAPPADD